MLISIRKLRERMGKGQGQRGLTYGEIKNPRRKWKWETLYLQAALLPSPALLSPLLSSVLSSFE